MHPPAGATSIRCKPPRGERRLDSMRTSAFLVHLAAVALLAPSIAIAQPVTCTNGNCQVCDASGNNCRPATQCEKKQAACAKKLSKATEKCSKNQRTLHRCVLRAQDNFRACSYSTCR
jgi:hypothetical protein